MRRVEVICPPHFTTITFQCSDDQDVLNWIYEHLEGRFYLAPSTAAGNLIPNDLKQKVGFELSVDAVMFSLHIDFLEQ